MPWVPFAIAAALTAAKMKSDAAMQEKTSQLKAAQEQYSPWTKLKPDQEIQQANYGQDLIGGAGMGLSAYGAQQNGQLNKALADRLNSGGSLEGYGRGASMPSYWDQNPYSEQKPMTPNYWASNPYSS